MGGALGRVPALAAALILPVLAIFAGLALLTFAADRFVDGAAALARNLGVSTLVIGLVVIGFGTSAPELLVSAMASLEGNPGISIGNALGSNVSNILLVAGFTALVRPLAVKSGIVRREFRVLGVATLLLWLLFADGRISRFDGVVLLVAMVASLTLLVRLSRGVAATDAILEEVESAQAESMRGPKAIAYTVGGLAGLLIGSRALVWGASSIAAGLGVSDLVIGLTVVAIGTSLPELAASIASARKGETDLVIGNIVGSNLFNSLAVIGLPGLLSPCVLPDGVLSRDMPILTVTSLVFYWMSSRSKKGGVLSRPEGLVLLAGFVVYEFLLFFGG